jgi:hypothetical protein
MTDFRKAGASILRVLQSALDPTAEAGKALIYAKDSGGTTKIFMRNSAGAVTEVGGGGGGAPTFHGARALIASQSIPNFTPTRLAADTEDFDTDGYHDNVTNNGRLTVPSGLAGYYLVTCMVSHVATVGARGCAIHKNAGNSPTPLPFSFAEHYAYQNGPGLSTTCSGVIYLAVGDEVQCSGYQSVGASHPVGGANSATTGMSYLALALIGS